MKIAIFYEHIRQAMEQSGGTFSDYVAAFSAAGGTGLEIRLPDLLENEAEILSALSEVGMVVSGLHADFDLGETDEENASGEFTLVDTAARLGIPGALIVPGFFTEAEADELDALANKSGSLAATDESMAAFSKMTRVQNTRKRMTALCAYAETKGVTISIEDYDFRLSPTRESRMMRWFMEQVPGLKITYDTGNFIMCKEDSGELVGYFGYENICHVHVKDRSFDQDGWGPIPAGDGYIPVEKIIKEIASSGYKGYYTIEHFNLLNQKDGMIRSAKNLVRIIGEAERN